MKGYKTIIFNLVMTGLMVLKMMSPETEIPGEDEISAGIDLVDGAITFVWGIGNLFLRAITDTPVFKGK